MGRRLFSAAARLLIAIGVAAVCNMHKFSSDSLSGMLPPWIEEAEAAGHATTI
jgi:hypothetical protein